jgi:hypothetical protein
MTHEDWLEAKRRRDTAARVALRRLLEGNVTLATSAAREWESAESDMERIEQELDGAS